MIKSKLRLFEWAVGLSLALGAVGAVAAQGAPVETKAALSDWELVTSAPSDWSGTYLIANDKTGTVKVLDGTSLSNNAFSYISGTHTVSNNKLSGIDDSYAIVILPSKKGTSGKYTIQAGSNYIGRNANSNGVDSVSTTGTYTANYDNSISFSSSDKKVTIAGNGGRVLTYLNSNDNFKYYAASNNNTRLFRKIVAEPSISINKSSVSGLKGDNGSAQITVNNFAANNCTATFSAPNIASIDATKNAAGNYDLKVNYTGVGSTTATITVTGTKSESLQVTLDISVSEKPKSIVLSEKQGTPWVDGKLEVRTGGSGSSGYKQVAVTALDTDDAAYTGALTWTSSNTDIVGVTQTGRIYGVAAGEATVTVSATALPSVKGSVTVKVLDDYNVSVNSVTFNNSLAANQGEQLDASAVVDTRNANTYFGSSTGVIDYSDFLFSYGNRESAVPADEFFYDFSGTDTDPGEGGKARKIQTVNVFVSFDEVWSGSFPITITKADVKVNGISVADLTPDGEGEYNLSLERGETYDLQVAALPNNTTESKAIFFDCVSEPDGAITCNQNGHVSALGRVGATAVIVASTDDDNESVFEAIINVTIVREAMTITVDEPTAVEHITKVTSTEALTTGQYLIVCESAAVALTDAEDATNNGTAVTISEGSINVTTAAKACLFEYDATVGSFRAPNGLYVAHSGSKNTLNPSEEPVGHTITFENGDATIAGSDGYILRYNAASGQERFRYYTSGQESIQLYKYSTSEEILTHTIDVDDDLFNIAYNEFGNEDYFVCNSDGTSFDTEGWNTLGTEFTSAIMNKYKLQYARADQNGNDVEKFLATYDYVIGLKEAGKALYAGADDYLDRVASGKIHGLAIANVRPSDSARTPLLVAAFAGVGALAVGGLFFLRKRKEF